MIETLGWIGGIMLAICALPQAIMSYRQGHSAGVSRGFLYLWGGGEVLTFSYVLMKHGLDLPLLTNYAVNITLIVVIWRYALWPRK